MLKRGPSENADNSVKRIKIKSAKRAHAALNFEALHPEVDAQKMCDKIGTMMSTYKTVTDLADSSGWGVDTEGHDRPMAGQDWVLQPCITQTFEGFLTLTHAYDSGNTSIIEELLKSSEPNRRTTQDIVEEEGSPPASMDVNEGTFTDQRKHRMIR